MRYIETHKVDPANDKLEIQVQDAPGQGGANHLYVVYGYHSRSNPSANSQHNDDTSTTILFQNGPIPQYGVNGLTHEVLLAIVKDRLEAFQRGPFVCGENADALDHICAAIEILHSRTRARMDRGVEGTNIA